MPAQPAGLTRLPTGPTRQPARASLSLSTRARLSSPSPLPSFSNAPAEPISPPEISPAPNSTEARDHRPAYNWPLALPPASHSTPQPIQTLAAAPHSPRRARRRRQVIPPPQFHSFGSALCLLTTVAPLQGLHAMIQGIQGPGESPHQPAREHRVKLRRRFTPTTPLRRPSLQSEPSVSTAWTSPFLCTRLPRS